MPVFPMVGGRARDGLQFRGTAIAVSWLLLDIYAADHALQVCSRPETFSHERFRDWDGGPSPSCRRGR